MTAIWSRRSRRRRRYTPKHQASRPAEARSLSSILGVIGGLLFLVALAGVLILQAWPPAAVVRSGSMAPGIDVGDVVVMRSLGGRDPQVGDVVQVTLPASAQRDFSYPASVTHRIVAIEDGMVTTQGDSLPDPDPFTVPVESIKTRVIAVVPFVGRVVAFVTSPLGLLWLGIGAAIFFIAPLHDLRRQPVLAAAPSEEVVEIRETVRELVSAVGAYGDHLRSHTAVVQEMGHASRDLAEVAARLEQVGPPPPALALPAPPPPLPPPALPAVPPPPLPAPPAPVAAAAPRPSGAPPRRPAPPPVGWRELVTFSETRRTFTTARADLRRVLGKGGPPAQ